MKNMTKRLEFFPILVLWLVLLCLVVAQIGYAKTDNPPTGFYRMFSTIEYVGTGEYRNQTEKVFAIEKNQIGDAKTSYIIKEEYPLTASPTEVSFTINKATHTIAIDPQANLLENVNNRCVGGIKDSILNNIGKTWKQTFDLSGIEGLPFSRISLTLTSLAIEKQNIGKMVAVRGLSEPIVIRSGEGPITARINSLYLFDEGIQEIYFSVSVFEAVIAKNGKSEIFRHENTCYKIDSNKKPVDIASLGSSFEKLLNMIKLTGSPLEVKEPSSLPDWVKNDAVTTAQACNVCAGIACEGGINPVAVVTLPVARVLDYQKNTPSEKAMSTAQLAAQTPTTAAGKQKMNIFEHIKANWGWNLETAAVVGGVGAGAVAIGGGFSGGGDSSASPASP